MSMIFCRECGKKHSSEAVACPHCGYTEVKSQYKGNKSIGTYLVLCLFIGIFGAHRFYAGKQGSAITMLISSLTGIGLLVTGVWAFIDFIIGISNINNPGKIFE